MHVNVDFPEKSLPEGHFFAIQHATPELLWKKELLAHANGATSLAMLTIAVTDPADFARRLGGILSVEAVGRDERVLTLRAARVRIVGPGWIAGNIPGKTPDMPYVAGIGLGVADLGQTADVLTRNGVDFRRKPDALTVFPADGCGSFIEFQPASA